MLSTSQGDDPLTIICGALHSFESFEYQKPLSKSQEYINDSLGPFNQLCSLEHLSTSDLISPRSRRSDKDYGGIPSNLITSCVATLLMIQVIAMKLRTPLFHVYSDTTQSAVHPSVQGLNPSTEFYVCCCFVWFCPTTLRNMNFSRNSVGHGIKSL